MFEPALFELLVETVHGDLLVFLSGVVSLIQVTDPLEDPGCLFCHLIPVAVGHDSSLESSKKKEGLVYSVE